MSATVDTFEEVINSKVIHIKNKKQEEILEELSRIKEMQSELTFHIENYVYFVVFLLGHGVCDANGLKGTTDATNRSFLSVSYLNRFVNEDMSFFKEKAKAVFVSACCRRMVHSDDCTVDPTG